MLCIMFRSYAVVVLSVLFMNTTPIKSEDIHDKYRFKRYSESSIVAQVGTIPYAVLVVSAFKNCSGSIIDENFVLTSAQCFVNNGVELVATVYAGIVDLEDQSPEAYQERETTEVYIPEEFTQNMLSKADIAIVKVIRPFKFNKYVDKIQISGNPWYITGDENEKSVDEEGKDCYLSGFMRNKSSNRQLILKQVVAFHGDSSCPCVTAELKSLLVCLEFPQGDQQEDCVLDNGGILRCDNDEGLAITHMHYVFSDLQSCRISDHGMYTCGDGRTIVMLMYLCPYLDFIHQYVDSVPPRPQSCLASMKCRSNLALMLLLTCIYHYVNCFE